MFVRGGIMRTRPPINVLACAFRMRKGAKESAEIQIQRDSAFELHTLIQLIPRLMLSEMRIYSDLIRLFVELLFYIEDGDGHVNRRHTRSFSYSLPDEPMIFSIVRDADCSGHFQSSQKRTNQAVAARLTFGALSAHIAM